MCISYYKNIYERTVASIVDVNILRESNISCFMMFIPRARKEPQASPSRPPKWSRARPRRCPPPRRTRAGAPAQSPSGSPPDLTMTQTVRRRHVIYICRRANMRVISIYIYIYSQSIMYMHLLDVSLI